MVGIFFLNQCRRGFVVSISKHSEAEKVPTILTGKPCAAISKRNSNVPKNAFLQKPRKPWTMIPSSLPKFKIRSRFQNRSFRLLALVCEAWDWSHKNLRMHRTNLKPAASGNKWGKSSASNYFGLTRIDWPRTGQRVNLFLTSVAKYRYTHSSI